MADHPDPINEGYLNAVEQTRERILHALSIFPFLSASMIHQAIGTSTSTKLWKPILADLVEQGAIIETHTTARSPLERQQSYTIYHLPCNEYTYSNGSKTSAA